MDLGLPGRFIMRDFPLRPAVCRESTAVGTNLQYMHHGWARTLHEEVLGVIALLTCSLETDCSHLLPVARHHPVTDL